MKKTIIRSDALPQNLQGELAKLTASLETRYGQRATIVGTMMENLAQMCALIGADLNEEERAAAYTRSREACADVLSFLGQVLAVNYADAVAVATAYRDFSQHTEEEMRGSTVLEGTADEALQVIAKARG